MFLRVILFVFLFSNVAFAQEFIEMPDELNSLLLKSVYENTLFIISDDNDLYLDKDLGKPRNYKKYWLGSPIKAGATIREFAIYFTPDKKRKVGDILLEDFNINIRKNRKQLFINHSSSPNKKGITMDRNFSARLWFPTVNKSDLFMIIPKQKYRSDALAFLMCVRARENKKLSLENKTVDTGYKINKISIAMTGQAKASLTTGSFKDGKVSLNIATSENIDDPEIEYDYSIGKDPAVDLSYFSNQKKLSDVYSDLDIVGGLSFLFDLQYESGQRRRSNFTNYFWIKKNYIDLPLSVIADLKGTKIKNNLGAGDCYTVILNAKILEHKYSDEKFTRNF